MHKFCLFISFIAVLYSAKAQTRPDTLKAKYHFALNKLEHYFYKNTPTEEEILLLAPIKRNYSSILSPQFCHYIDSLETQKLVTSPKLPYLSLFRRFMKDSIYAKVEDRTKLKGIDAATFSALYCDKFPLPDSFLLTMQRFALAGKYKMTHVSIILALMQENGGFKQDKKAWNELLAQQPKMLQNQILKAPFLTDLEIESAALLSLYHQQPSNEWIIKMLSLQFDEGGFPPHEKMGEKMKQASLHSSVLAMWALCAWLADNKVSFRFIPKK